jgi:L-threonylcarbamoyladenylate synthase
MAEKTSPMRATLLKPSPENLTRTAAAIARGEVVGMPTETVYGLAGAAFQPEALARIFDTKERPTFDPLILHVGLNGKGIFELERLKLIDGSQLSDTARTRAHALIQAFWPGPLTLVLPKHEQVPDLATSGLPTVAIRMPAHSVAQALIAASQTPLAAPSANRFGRISPTTAQAVAEELGDRIDWILDGGPCEIGVESTVIRVENDGTLLQLRPGGLTRAQLEFAAGCRIGSVDSNSRPVGTAPSAPGMLDSHYAPVKPMFLLPAPLAQLEPRQWEEIVVRAGDARNLGFLLQSGDENPALIQLHAELRKAGSAHLDLTVSSLSLSGDLREAARGLFAKMRALDASAAQVIFAEPCTVDRGLGHAIADRLGRACRAKM